MLLTFFGEVEVLQGFKISVWATWYQEQIAVAYLDLLDLLVINQVHFERNE